MVLREKIKVWDPVIRIFHWSLAASFLLNFGVLDDESTAHEWIGYYVLGILVIRLLWGFIGPRNARFVDFFPTKAKLKMHFAALLRGEPHDPNRHNPAGGVMIIALLSTMLLTGLSGWMMTLDMFWGTDWVESIHDAFANITMLLVIVHVAAVSFFSWRGPHNLIRIMLTGYRSP
ncbi:cytochrome b/b6 domain-containing protein [Motiliproteus sp. MSK22-1]|uniref:cytochrome b/b6 domain-containing protein n=1 Tax=Motiliproteus sp. MSK22-1 TaxID=1897630 RepID=UPI00097869E1|nr:cytochrome b/b6 domain-containing protein [Motiliproteus sp. MSK22-1]OMH28025.1 cytochrome B [Motiliproteus sp. MSK22-1]